MNNKGFTTVEVILTLAIVVIIMATITGVTYVYRDRSTYEQLITEFNNYKNEVTKVIYDDILNIDGDDASGKVIKIEESVNGYKLITDTNVEYDLEIINTENEKGIKYNNVKYIIPYSKNYVTFDGVEFYEPTNSEAEFYALDIFFSHQSLENKIKIHLIVLG